MADYEENPCKVDQSSCKRKHYDFKCQLKLFFSSTFKSETKSQILYLLKAKSYDND